MGKHNTTAVLATANRHKASEISQILVGWELLPRPTDVADIDETADTLVGNARLKARAICEATNQPALADDTGLEVDALDGRPGVHSARYAGENATDEDNVAKLLAELDELAEAAGELRTARFCTVALLRFPDGREVVGMGVIEGTIASQQRGTNGFGYDVVFIPDCSHDGRTFAEMTAQEKNQISHRKLAFEDLRRQIP